MKGWLLYMALVAFALVACDEGKIYDDPGVASTAGITISMRGEVSGCDDYEAIPQYSVALAVFREDDDFAVSSKPVENGDDDVVLSNIPADVSTVEVCVIDRLRKRVMTFAAFDVSKVAGNAVEFNVGELNVGMFPAIQREIFSVSCAQCHGATGHPAAGLDLMPGKAYGMLVGVHSTVVGSELRVDPGHADVSTLWQAVATDVSSSWAFNHANLLTDEKSDFIENWINKVAK